MITFKQFLSESYKNLFSEADKEKYADMAYDQLISAYAKIGGIKGTGFESKEAFIKHIPFWKLNFSKDGKLLAAGYYKDKDGRKLVAMSSDGSAQGKRMVADIMISDLLQERAYTELSKNSLSFLVKQIGYDEVKRHAIPIDKMESLLGEDLAEPDSNDQELIDHPELKEFLYQRTIGGVKHTKIALGKTHKRIA